jgi:3-oxoacyl-[acyl-carrier protein] reductase
MRLEGKTAIITGGAQGFGGGIVDKFIAEGAKVLVADIQGDKARAKAAEVGNAATPCEVDVADNGSVKAMMDTAMEAFGRYPSANADGRCRR